MKATVPMRFLHCVLTNRYRPESPPRGSTSVMPCSAPPSSKSSNSLEFYGFATFHVLLNPNNPMVQTVVTSMIENGAPFIFAVDADERVTAFRADVGRSMLAGLSGKLPPLFPSATWWTQYSDTLA